MRYAGAKLPTSTPIASTTRSRAFRQSLPPLAGFAALSIAWTWPLARYLSSRIAHDPGDPILNVWLLWWNAHAVPFTEHWWSPPILHPMRGALALSEHLAGIGIVTTPLQLAGANAVAAYNVALILSFALSGLFAFLLVRRLTAVGDVAGTMTADRDPFVVLAAAICAGLAYGFGPYRAGQLSHLQVLTSQWMPLALLAMHAYLDDGRRRWLAILAGAWLLQALSNGYYLLFFPVLVAMWLAWFVDWRGAPRRGLALAAVFAAASLPLVPILLKYATVQHALGLARTPTEMVRFSGTPASLLHASGMLRFWPAAATETTEDLLFPGVTTVALVIAAAIAAAVSRGRRRAAPRLIGAPLPFYGMAAVVMTLLAFGPLPADASPWLAWLHPYTLLTYLPGFEGLRAPARFDMLATLCLSIAAGLAFARLATSLTPGVNRVSVVSGARGDGLASGSNDASVASGANRVSVVSGFSRTVTPWQALLAVVVVTGLSIDGCMRPMPLVVPPARVLLPDLPNAVVMELPVDDGTVGVAAMFREMHHGRPIVNAYTGYTPPHYAILSIALRRHDPSAVTELARNRPLIMFVNETFDPDGAFLRLVRGIPGVQAQGATSAGAMFVLPAQPAARIAAVGAPLPARITNGGAYRADIDLGAPRIVRTIEFPVRWRYEELDPRIAIEASLDGRAWSTIWEDWTGGPALAAALRDPLVVPVRLTVADVSARYLRLHPAADWLMRELKVYGPE